MALATCAPLILLFLLNMGLSFFGYDYTPRQKILWKPMIAGFIGTYEYYIQTEFAPPGYIWKSEKDTPVPMNSVFANQVFPSKGKGCITYNAH